MGKIIVVPEKLRINSDNQGWLVEEAKVLTADRCLKGVVTDKKGDTVWEVVPAGYCGNRVAAIKRCIDWRCKELPDMMLKDFIEANAKFNKEVIEALG